MRKTFLAALFCAALAFGQIGPPRAGVIRTSDGQVRPVLGIPGSVVLGDPVAFDAISAASSGRWTLVKTSSSLVALDEAGGIAARVDGGDGPALFAFAGNGASAIALLPSSGTFFRWTASRFETLSVITDPIVASNAAGLAVSNRGHLWIAYSAADGLHMASVLASTGDAESDVPLADVSLPLLVSRDGGVIFSDGHDIVMRDGSGVERRVAQPASVAALEWAADDCVLIREASGTRLFALRIAPGREQITQLPEGGSQ